MLVLRLETSDGGGPFNSEMSQKHFAKHGKPILTQPYDLACPLDDGIEDFECGTDFVGVKSVSCLQVWFNRNDFEELKKCKIRIRAFEVPKKYVKIGRTQVCFRKDKAKLVSDNAVYSLVS